MSTHHHPISALDHALAYASMGWRVVPIPRGQKYPRFTAWQRVAETDTALIEAWWRQYPDDGVGIVTGAQSGVWVLDIDRHGVVDGDETLADLVAEHGPLPDTVEAITGSGGRHLFFAWPTDGTELRNDQAGALGPGLDVRAEGGQVVAAPSLHPDTGRAYEWEASSSPLDGVAPASAPEWLVRLLADGPSPTCGPRRDRLERPANGDLPGDIFASRVAWPELLEADGWTLHSTPRAQGGYELWTRPGKTVRDGASASLYYRGSDSLKVFSSDPGLQALGLVQGQTYTRWGYYVTRRHGGDFEGAARAYRRQLIAEGASDGPPRVQLGESLTGSCTAEALEETARRRPVIVANGRHLDELVAEAIEALTVANDPPTLFVRSGMPVRVREDEAGRPLVEQLRSEHLRFRLAETARWVRIAKDGGATPVSPPQDVVMAILGVGTWPWPALAGITEAPMFRPDGTIQLEHGYDPATRLYHWARGTQYRPVPEEPDADELAAAVELISEVVCDFPFDTSADRANAWGLLLTQVVRPLIEGQVPMALLDAPEPGTGKGLLANVVSIVTTGRSASIASWPSSDEELEKKITTFLMSGATTVLWDNVDGTIRSPVLAAALTADTWQGRILGRSEQVLVPNRATWMATGNNVDVGGDLARRCYRIRLDARQAQPWKRTGFRHPDLGYWVTTQRAEILRALLVLVRAWWVAGRPSTDEAAMGGYTPWVRTVGGILAHAGVHDFLGNLDTFHAQADRDAQAWEAFLTTWWEELSDSIVTPREIAARITDEHCASGLVHTLPDELVRYLGKPSFAQRVGEVFLKKAGRHFGDAGLHITHLGRDRMKRAQFALASRREGPRGSALTARSADPRTLADPSLDPCPDEQGLHPLQPCRGAGEEQGPRGPAGPREASEGGSTPSDGWLF